jgi:hypothetical protein
MNIIKWPETKRMGGMIITYIINQGDDCAYINQNNFGNRGNSFYFG